MMTNLKVWLWKRSGDTTDESCGLQVKVVGREQPLTVPSARSMTKQWKGPLVVIEIRCDYEVS